MDSNSTLVSNIDDYIKIFSYKIFAKAFQSSVFENDSTPDEFLSSYERFFSSLSETNQSTDMDYTIMPHPIIFNIHKERNAGNGTDEAYQDNITFFLNRYIDGYATLVTACIGLSFNTVGTYFLLRGKGYKQMFNLLLAINLMFDTTYLVFQILRSLHTHFVSFTRHPSVGYYIIMNSGERSTYILSVLMLVGLAHSRYQAVTNPYEGRKIRLYWSVRRKQLLKYLLPAIFFATCFTVPTMFEIDSETLTKSGNFTTFVIPSKMRLNWYYSIFFISSLNILFLGIFPFVSLLYFTYYILSALNQRKKFIEYTKPHDDSIKRRNCNNGNLIEVLQPKENLNRRRCNNNKALKTSFLLIFIFLFLHSLRLVTSVGELIVILGENNISDHILQHGRGIPKWLEVVMSLSNLCMVINASINFLVYMFLNSSITIKNVSFCKPPCLSKPSCSQQNKDIVLHEVGIQRITSEVVAKVDIVSACSPVDKRINGGVSFIVAKTREEWL